MRYATRTRASEEAIHRAILEWLRLALPHALVMHTPNGGSRNAIEAAKLKRLGVVAGWPDLTIALRSGRTVYFEVKTDKGRLSPQQRAVILDLEDMGHPVAVVRSIDDAKAALERWGIETREAA